MSDVVRVDRVDVVSSPRPTGVAGVDDSDGLDKQCVDLSVGDRAVFRALRDDVELPGGEGDVPVPKLNGQLTVDDEEQLVGVLVGVPNELTLDPEPPLVSPRWAVLIVPAGCRGAARGTPLGGSRQSRVDALPEHPSRKPCLGVASAGEQGL